MTPDSTVPQSAREGSALLPRDARARWFLLARSAGGILVVALLVGIVWYRSGVELRQVIAVLANVRLEFLLLAFLAYYGAFPLRGARWRILLHERDESRAVPGLRTLVRFYLYGWLLNCALPAKLGELYRAFLVHRRAHLPFSTVLATVLVERAADLVVLACLLPISAVAIGAATQRQLLSLQLIAAALGVAVIAGLVLVRRSRRFLRLLPAFLERPASGLAVGLALRGRTWIVLGAVTLPLWALECLRVYAAALALGLPLTLPITFVIALVAALLTTLPLTPAGIGAVEVGIAGTLVLLGFPTDQAIALALLDRLVAYWSVFLVAGVPWMVERVRGA